MTIQCGTGDKTLTIDDADITGAAKVTLGSGHNTINILNGAAFDGAFDFKTTGGKTNLTVDTVTFAGLVTINTGSGDDTLTIDDSTFNAAVKINTGAGGDQLLVDTGKSDSGPITWFKQALTANLATGNDTVRLGGGTAGKIVRFGAASTIDAGAGIDGKYTWLDGNVIPTILSAEIALD